MYTSRVIKVIIVFLVGSIILISGSNLCKAATELEKVLEERSCHMWIEGQVLGDMIIGARAQVMAVVVDSELVDSIKDDSSAPEWLSWHCNHFGSAPSGEVLIIIRYKTLKYWEFEPSDITINGYIVKDDDIITRKDYIVRGTIPPDTKGTFAMYVPVQKGNDTGKGILNVACDGYSCSIKMPERMN